MHLVRPAVESDIVPHRPMQAAMLRFQNGAEARSLEPAPLDWPECDDLTPWHYAE